MTQDAPFSCQGGDLGHRLQGADFVVCVHDRHENRLIGEGRGHTAGVCPAKFIDGYVGGGEPAGFEVSADFAYGGMFHGGGHYVPAPVFGRQRGADDGVVVGFGPAAGENDALGVGSQKVRGLTARLFNGRAGPLPKDMTARRVAEMFAQIGDHRLGHTRVDGSGGVVIQVNRVGLAEGLHDVLSGWVTANHDNPAPLSWRPWKGHGYRNHGQAAGRALS